MLSPTASQRVPGFRNENSCARSKKLGTQPQHGESEQSEDESRDYTEAISSTLHLSACTAQAGKESRRLTQRTRKKAIYGWKLSDSAKSRPTTGEMKKGRSWMEFQPGPTGDTLPSCDYGDSGRMASTLR